MSIITYQDKVKAVVQGLIDDTTISASFGLEDNEIVVYDLPLVIVDLNETRIQNTSSGRAADGGYSLKLIVVDAISNHSDSFKDTRTFVIDALRIILNNLNVSIEDNIIRHDSGLYGRWKSARVEVNLNY